MREVLPDDILIARVLIENNLLEQRFSSALEEVDFALTLAPDRDDLLRTRLVLLAQLGMDAEVETQLAEMIARNPADAESKEALIRWHHVARGNRKGRRDPARRCDARRRDDRGVSPISPSSGPCRGTTPRARRSTRSWKTVRTRDPALSPRRARFRRRPSHRGDRRARGHPFHRKSQAKRHARSR
jgi:hypothetical protein